MLSREESETSVSEEHDFEADMREAHLLAGKNEEDDIYNAPAVKSEAELRYTFSDDEDEDSPLLPPPVAMRSLPLTPAHVAQIIPDIASPNLNSFDEKQLKHEIEQAKRKFVESSVALMGVACCLIAFFTFPPLVLAPIFTAAIWIGSLICSALLSIAAVRVGFAVTDACGSSDEHKSVRSPSVAATRSRLGKSSNRTVLAAVGGMASHGQESAVAVAAPVEVQVQDIPIDLGNGQAARPASLRAY